MSNGNGNGNGNNAFPYLRTGTSTAILLAVVGLMWGQLDRISERHMEAAKADAAAVQSLREDLTAQHKLLMLEIRKRHMQGDTKDDIPNAFPAPPRK